MNLLVTGGAGFIGSNFISYMLKQHPDYRIVCMDKLTYAGNLDTLRSVLDLAGGRGNGHDRNLEYNCAKAGISGQEAARAVPGMEFPEEKENGQKRCFGNDVSEGVDFHFAKGDSCGQEAADVLIAKENKHRSQPWDVVSEGVNFRFVKGDICDREAVYALFAEERPDMVVNFAAESHVDRSIEDPSVFLKTNIIGTSVLMDACRKYGIRRFHQISTDEVYGDLPLDRPDLLFTEETPLHTSSPYSSSKASADLLVLAYHRTYGLPVSISRCSNNYGPYQHTEKLIPRMIAYALADRPLPVYGTGRNVRDWLYVEDHCRAIDRILHSSCDGKVYNVGGGTQKSNLEIVRLICRELGKPESLITFVPDRKGHDLRYAIDPAKIWRELGWAPQTEFEAGIRETIHWYLANRDWWEELL